MFAIFDELFLLSLHKEKCTLLPGISKNLEVGLSGAVLAELIVQNKIQVTNNSKLELIDAAPTGDAVLDEAIDLFQQADKLRKLSYWFDRLNEKLPLGKKQLANRLVGEKILSQGEEGLFWTLPFEEASDQKASAWFVIKSRLREPALTQGEAPLCQLALLSIMKASRLLRLVFTKDELKIARRWIYASLMDRAMKEPAAQSLQEIEAAVEGFIEEL